MSGLAATSPRDIARLLQPFKVVAFDWDGTAVMGRKEDAAEVCAIFDRLMARGVAVVVITGTNIVHTSRQLAPSIRGPNSRQLFVATNRGSEVFGFDGGPEPVLLWKRNATPEEERQLTASADAMKESFARDHGLEVRVIYDRLNRRKIDLVPLPEWADPPKWQIGQLLDAVQARLAAAGLDGGLQQAIGVANELARRAGLRDPRVTSDVKHVEIGLTDKSDSIAWLMREVCERRGVAPSEVLIAGDEFGPIGGAEGSDYKMVTPLSQGAVFASVGPEPNGPPDSVIHLGGGPRRFRRLLAIIADIHDGIRVPGDVRSRIALPAERTDDPTWTVLEEGVSPTREHDIESLLAIGNGYVGTRGSLAEGALHASNPATFLAGVFDTPAQPPSVPEYAVAPDWTRVVISVAGRDLTLKPESFVENHRTLDMKQGMAWREWRHRDGDGRVTLVRGLRMASLSDRHLLLQSLVIVPENYSGRVRVRAVIEPARTSVAGVPLARPYLVPVPDPEAHECRDPSVLLFRTPSADTYVAFAATARLEGRDGEPGPRRVECGDGRIEESWEFDGQLGEAYRLDRLVTVYTSRDCARPVAEAARALRGAPSVEMATGAHLAAWQANWHACDVAVDGDPEAQRAMRFAAYHLISAANPEDDRVSIGARTLTGESYKGHVFWDTETFILPFFSFTAPRTARALLMYRYHTLPAARAKAQGMGYRGALYAWESADTGEETTPRFMLAPDGEVLRILCGEEEHHISADVAYAVHQYWQATGDDGFYADAGAEILIETARFWASRGHVEDDGHFHIRKVIGPDEYHESIDDNAYTNLMAQWNIETGLEAARWLERNDPERYRALCARVGLTEAELSEWPDLARVIYVGYDAGTGLIEQFRGYFDLEDYDLGPMRAEGKRAAPLDMLLGREKIRRSKVVKQADVVMAIQLLWDRLPPKVREANFRYYEPRTCHGSSLSPGVHALVAARLGMLDVAAEYFRQASRIDLGNGMGNAAGGVHAAALGGLWQAAVMGFAGLQLREGRLAFDPHLPKDWKAMQFPVQWRGARLTVGVGAEPPSLRVRHQGEAETELLVGGERLRVAPGRESAVRRDEGGWRGWKDSA